MFHLHARLGQHWGHLPAVVHPMFLKPTLQFRLLIAKLQRILRRRIGLQFARLASIIRSVARASGGRFSWSISKLACSRLSKIVRSKFAARPPPPLDCSIHAPVPPTACLKRPASRAAGPVWLPRGRGPTRCPPAAAQVPESAAAFPGTVLRNARHPQIADGPGRDRVMRHPRERQHARDHSGSGRIDGSVGSGALLPPIGFAFEVDHHPLGGFALANHDLARFAVATWHGQPTIPTCHPTSRKGTGCSEVL